MTEQKKDFEASLKRLEEITKRLESAETPLEESLKLFEEGTGLVRALTRELDDAQQKVTMLVKSETGELTETEFAPQKD